MQYIVWLLYNLIFLIYRSFLDNIAIRGSNINYNNKKIPNLLRVRRYIAEYIKNLNNIFYNVELAGAAINARKLE